MRSAIALFLICLMTCAGAAWAEEPPPFPEKAATPELMKQLKKGGFVLYMRHGNSDTSKPDRVPQVDLNDCSTQRPLTEEGRQVARRVGQAIRRAHIPVGEVFASPLCRTKQTAEAAFGKGYAINNGLMYTANLTTDEKAIALQTVRGLLTTPVPAGKNRVLVAHAPNLMDLMGYFPKPEATVVVFRPDPEKGFEYLASIHPDDWKKLVR